MNGHIYIHAHSTCCVHMQNKTQKKNTYRGKTRVTKRPETLKKIESK